MMNDKWVDYFKKLKTKGEIQTVHDAEAFLEESFTHTSTQLKQKGRWTDYFKDPKKLKNPISSTHDLGAFLEYSVTGTSSQLKFKGSWIDYFKKWRKEEENPFKHVYNLEGLLEVPYIVNPTKKGILVLVDTYTLPNTGRGVSFTSDNAYIAVSHAAGAAPNDTQVTLLKLVNDELAYADSYQESANVWDTAFHPGGEYIACTRDGVSFILILQRSGDALSFVRRVNVPYGSDGMNIQFIDEDYFLVTNYSTVLRLYSWSGADPVLKDTESAAGYTNDFGINDDKIALSISAVGTQPRVQIFAHSGDSLSHVANGMGDSKYGNSYCAAFNNDGSKVIVTNGNDNYELVVLSFDGSSLVVEKEHGTVVENFPSKVRMTPDGKFAAVNHYNSPYLSLFGLSGNDLTRTSTYTLPGRAIDIRFSPDGEYLGVAHYGSPYFTLLRIV